MRSREDRVMGCHTARGTAVIEILPHLEGNARRVRPEMIDDRGLLPHFLDELMFQNAMLFGAFLHISVRQISSDRSIRWIPGLLVLNQNGSFLFSTLRLI